MKRGARFIRPTTTPGTSPSWTSWSTRAKVIVNSYSECETLAKFAYVPAICSGTTCRLIWRSGPVARHRP